MNPRTISNVVVNRLREGVWLLEHHTHARPKRDHVDSWIVNVVLVDLNLTVDTANIDRVIHTVQTPQERGLTTPRWSDKRDHLTNTDIKRDVVNCAFITVIHIH